jgi:hypothetical protein
MDVREFEFLHYFIFFRQSLDTFLAKAQNEVWKLEAEVDYHRDGLANASERYKAARKKFLDLVSFFY